MGIMRTLGWNIADFILKNCITVPSGQTPAEFFSPELCKKPEEKRAGKVLACCDPTGAEFYEEWLPFATTCCLCGAEILPGDSVVLRNINEHDLAEKATLVGEEYAVGCLQAGCGPFALYGDGFWTKHGYCPADKFMGVDTLAQV